MVKNEMTRINIPQKLLSGFLDFAKNVNLQSEARGLKFTEEEIEQIFEASFSGRIRAIFFIYLGDLNRILEGIDLILDDLIKMRDSKESMVTIPLSEVNCYFEVFLMSFFF